MKMINPDRSLGGGMPQPTRFEDYFFIQDFKDNKKGDVVKVQLGYNASNSLLINEALKKGILITKSEKEFIDKYPIKIKSLVFKKKEQPQMSDRFGMGIITALTPDNMAINVEPNIEYRGILLDDGKFKVIKFGGANIILEKGEYELLDKSVSSSSTQKDNSNLVKIALLLVGGYLVYKLVKK